jgi:DNA-binding ferritin-like protein
MRAVIFLVLGLLIGGVGATLFTRSLPPPPGTEAESAALLARDLERAQARIASLESTEANAAARLHKLAADGKRSIFQDLKDGRPVDLNDLFTTAKPFLHDFAPLMDRMRRRDQKRMIEQTLADLTKKHGLDAAQQAGLKKALEDQADAEAGRLREVTGRADSTLEDYAKAMQDRRPLEGIDAYMEQTLRGEELTKYKTDRMAERVNRVQYEADRRVEQLNGIVALDDNQQDRVFALMARSSRDFDPGMQMEGLGDDRATLAQGQSRDEAILAVLRPDQREAYEAHRASQRQRADEEMAEIGLKLPADWDMFGE